MMLNAAVAIAAYDPSTNNYMVEESTGWWPDGQMHSYTRHYNAVEAAGIDPEDLKTRPLFSDFLRRQVYGAGGHDFLSSTNEVSRMARWRMLSHGIPSESFAVGANPVPKWRPAAFGCVSVACLSLTAIALQRMSVLYFGRSSGRLSKSQPLIPPLRPTTSPDSPNFRQLST